MKLPVLMACAITLFPSILTAQNIDDNITINRNVFNRFDLGVSLGTTGIGIDLSTNVTNWVRLRAGVDYMPKFTVPMSFSITGYKADANATDGYTVNESNFSKLQDLMYGFTNVHVDENVDMEGSPRFYNFKFLFDFMPLRNKDWHVTAGFYLGSSKIATARNTIEEMPSLLAVNMYNHFYDFAQSGAFWDEPMIPGYDDYYMSKEMADKLIEKGAVGIHVGDKKDGSPYMMRPGSDGLVRASVIVNSFRPYVGFGYNKEIAGSNGRLSLGFDAGAMFWGGSPKIVTHEGVDLVGDMSNVRGKVGTYVDIIKAFKVYPTINFRIAYKLF
jgi:hypothetical protein